MNSSHFMDKQILGLSGSQQQQGEELFDLMNPQEENGSKKEEIVPSYDFQPIRTVGSSPPTTSGGGFGDGPPPSWASADSKLNASIRKNASILETHELSKVNHGKGKGAYDDATVAEIDHTVKKHADILLHALEGISSRLSQLESRTLHLENSIDELKTTIGNNSGSTDGKLRQLGNILGEVQTGVQVLRDKQEIWEAQLELRKLEVSKVHSQTPEMANTTESNFQPQQVSPAQQPIQQLHQPVAPTAQPNMLPALPAPDAPPPHVAQRNPPSAQYPAQLPQTQMPSVPSLPRESYFVSPAQSTENAHPQYQVPVQQPQPPPPPPQHYQSSPQIPQYSQPPQIPQPVNPSPQLQPPLPQHPEESAPYMPPPQTYPSNIRQPPSFTQPPTGPPPNQFYGPNPSVYEPPTSRTSSGPPPISSGYGPPMGPSYSDAYAYSGSPSHRSSSAIKSAPFASSATSTGGSSYARLPTAQILPQALPTGQSGPSAGGSSGNRVPVDDVVEKVATMGFSRDQVRATVRKLTENGQSVDLNVVLDKLMNDSEIQPQKGWFGR